MVAERPGTTTEGGGEAAFRRTATGQGRGRGTHHDALSSGGFD